MEGGPRCARGMSIVMLKVWEIGHDHLPGTSMLLALLGPIDFLRAVASAPQVNQGGFST